MKIATALILALTICATGAAKAPSLQITLETNTDSEKQARSLILEFAKKYDLSKCTFTPKIHIQAFTIPHSHPVLTLNTRNIKEPDRHLALFLHEQIHWFFDDGDRPGKTKEFIAKMKKKFPSHQR